jgi:hypothetical protein
MVNIKARGFESPDQLREVLEEIAETETRTPPENRQILREIASLRARLEDLRIRVGEILAEEGLENDEDLERHQARKRLSRSALSVASGALVALLLGLLQGRRERASKF